MDFVYSWQKTGQGKENENIHTKPSRCACLGYTK